jgi:hypothetical protein
MIPPNQTRDNKFRRCKFYFSVIGVLMHAPQYFHLQLPIEVLFNIRRTNKLGDGELWFAQPIIIMVGWLCKSIIIKSTARTKRSKSTAYGHGTSTATTTASITTTTILASNNRLVWSLPVPISLL